jgi:hypothetical protein
LKKSYFAVVEGAASVVDGATTVVSVGDGVTIVVSGAGAVVSVDVVVSSLPLQAARAAVITNAKKSFFMFSVFLSLFKQIEFGIYTRFKKR